MHSAEPSGKDGDAEPFSTTVDQTDRNTARMYETMPSTGQALY